LAEFLVELFVSRTNSGAVDEGARRARAAAAELSGEGTPVRFVRTLYVPEEETCFYLLEAASAEQAREVTRRAELVSARVVEAVTESRGARPGSR
jgi:Nickel responsive protein SCO4226-like